MRTSLRRLYCIDGEGGRAHRGARRATLRAEWDRDLHVRAREHRARWHRPDRAVCCRSASCGMCAGIVCRERRGRCQRRRWSVRALGATSEWGCLLGLAQRRTSRAVDLAAERVVRALCVRSCWTRIVHHTGRAMNLWLVVVSKRRVCVNLSGLQRGSMYGLDRRDDRVLVLECQRRERLQSNVLSMIWMRFVVR